MGSRRISIDVRAGEVLSDTMGLEVFYNTTYAMQNIRICRLIQAGKNDGLPRHMYMVSYFDVHLII